MFWTSDWKWTSVQPLLLAGQQISDHSTEVMMCFYLFSDCMTVHERCRFNVFDACRKVYRYKRCESVKALIVCMVVIYRTFLLYVRCYEMVITVRAMLCAVYAMALLCLCVCLCLSVTSHYCIRTATHKITQTTPYDSPGTLVFWCQKSFWNWGGKCRWGRPKLANFDK